jgi:cell division septation protein DedD
VAETHEPSYYEIALTNRQVVVAFVILLSCVLAAFLSGVWIGRESTARAAQEQMVRNSPPQQQAANEGRNLDELEFFDARKKKGEERTARQEAVAEPPANSTLFDDLNRRKKNDEPAPVQETPPVSEPAPAQVTPPAPAPSRVEPAADPDGLTKAERRRLRRERQKAAAAAAAQTAPPAPARVAGKTAEPAVPKGSYVIQVFSSADKAQADSIRARLAGGGQKAYLSPIDRGGRTMYRVRIGPFKSRGDAQTVADKVRKGYKLDTWVTE